MSDAIADAQLRQLDVRASSYAEAVGRLSGGNQQKVIIGRWLARDPSVRLAFFDRQPDTTTPNYEVAMRYWENGVADDMQMDFGDFVMNAKMTEFALQPRKC